MAGRQNKTGRHNISFYDMQNLIELLYTHGINVGGPLSRRAEFFSLAEY